MIEYGYKLITGTTSKTELFDAIAEENIGFVKDSESGNVYWKTSPYHLKTSSNADIGVAAPLQSNNTDTVVGIVGTSSANSTWAASVVHVIDYIKFGDNIIFGIRPSTGYTAYHCAIIAPTENNVSWYYVGHSTSGSSMINTFSKTVSATNIIQIGSNWGQAQNNYGNTAYPADSLLIGKIFDGFVWLDNGLYLVMSSPRLGNYTAQKYVSGDKTFLICRFANVDTQMPFAIDITNDLVTT